MNVFETPLTLEPLGPGVQYLWIHSLAGIALGAITASSLSVPIVLVCLALTAVLFFSGVYGVTKVRVTALRLDAGGSLLVRSAGGSRQLYAAGSYRVEQMPGLWFFGVPDGRTTHWVAVASAALSGADRTCLAWRLSLR